MVNQNTYQGINTKGYIYTQDKMKGKYFYGNF